MRVLGIERLKRDGTRAEARFRLSPKRTNPFKSAGASVPSTAGSRGVRISGSNAGNTMFRGSVKGTSYPLHSPVSPSLPPTPVRHLVPSGFKRTIPRTIPPYNGMPGILQTTLFSSSSMALRSPFLGAGGGNGHPDLLPPTFSLPSCHFVYLKQSAVSHLVHII